MTCILISVFASMAGSLFIQIIIDDYILQMLETGEDLFEKLIRVLAVMAGIYLVGAFATLFYNRTIATIPIGYADGVSRCLSNKIYGTLNGKQVPQVGNITMDQMMFDITGVEANIGDIISLIDEKNTVDNWANILGTINYELTCRLKVRLPRVYTR